MMSNIEKYFKDLSNKQKEQFAKLEELYRFWNAQINVISRKDMEHFEERHVLHSLGIAKVIHFAPKSHILDVGTGGGLPGIPLAILFPESQFHLIDSIGKKIKVVQEVAMELGLENVVAEQIRAENTPLHSYDFVVSRAVTRMPTFLEWTSNKINKNDKNSLPNGILYLKGGDLQEEMKNIDHIDFALSNYFPEPFFDTKKVIYVATND